MKGKLVKLVAPLPYSIKRLLFRTWLAVTSAGHVANKGERVVVSSWKELISTHEFYHIMHAHRYVWAAQQLKNCVSLLDYGCGSGYGTWYLSSTHKAPVYGFDIDLKAIAWAHKHFHHEYLAYITALPLIKFDGIASFEVIEHIEDQQQYIYTLKSMLATNGTLLISTANGSRESVRQQLIDKKLVTVNHTHVRELTASEFLALLKKNFTTVQLYGQCVANAYNFDNWNQWRRKNTVTIEDFKMKEDDTINCEVIVAVCKK